MTDTNKETEISQKTTQAKRAAAKKTSTNKSALVNSGNEVLYKMIQEAAYFIAKRNNFYGDPQSFWLEAEMQINGLLSL
jgi:hypothetical protein